MLGHLLVVKSLQIGVIEVAKVFALIVFFAFLVERLTEIVFGRLIDELVKFEKLKFLLKIKFVSIYLAMGFGVLGAFIYQFDLIFLLGQMVGYLQIKTTMLGIIATGLVIGGGSNLLHDIWKTFFIKNEIIDTLPPKV